MPFALTKYIYPLELPIEFFSVPKYCFDNARTQGELALVKDFISKSLQLENAIHMKENHGLQAGFSFGLGELKDYLKMNSPNEYALHFYESKDDTRIIDLLAETWIIVRFEDGGDFDKILLNRDSLFELMIYRRKTQYTKAFNKLLHLSHLLSLLSHNEDQYVGETFLLTTKPYDILFEVGKYDVSRPVEHCKSMNMLHREDNRAKYWSYWLDGKDHILKEANRLQEIFLQQKSLSQKDKNGSFKKIQASQKQAPSEKLLHIGNYLRMSSEHIRDPELMLLILVGIIEYLLTTKSDENSITRQLRTKSTILLHVQYPDDDLLEIDNNLKQIYDLRSDIAHGNYKEEYSEEEEQKEIVEKIFTLYKYLRAIINVYIDDRKLVDHLKDN